VNLSRGTAVLQYRSGIYAITHLLSGRRYVGSAVRLVGRFKDHLYMLRKGNHHCRYLQNAWNKYGSGAFRFSVLERCSESDLIEREQYWIDSTPSGTLFNHALVAGSVLGIKRSEETKRKLSESRRGMKFTDSHRAAISAALIGRTGKRHTPESLTLISERAKEASADPEERRRRAERARRQHATGQLKPPTQTPKSRICKSCGGNFVRPILPNGKRAQSEYCPECAPGRNWLNACPELGCVIRTGGKPKALYPGV
jgi:group I intron endonuclease